MLVLSYTASFRSLGQTDFKGKKNTTLSNQSLMKFSSTETLNNNDLHGRNKPKITTKVYFQAAFFPCLTNGITLQTLIQKMLNPDYWLIDSG